MWSQTLSSISGWIDKKGIDRLRRSSFLLGEEEAKINVSMALIVNDERLEV